MSCAPNWTTLLQSASKKRVSVNECKSHDDFLEKKDNFQRSMKMSKFTIMNIVEKKVNEQYNFLKEQNERIDNMYEDYNDLVEYEKVIEVSQEILIGEEFKGLQGRISHSTDKEEHKHRGDFDPEEAKGLLLRRKPSDASSEVVSVAELGGVKVGRVVGTCLNKDLFRLKRLLFRATRGNALVLSKNEDGIETYNKETIPKSVFIVVFQEGEQLRSKIETITNNFSKHTYNLPKGSMENKRQTIKDRIEQTRQLIVISLAGIEKYLMSCNIDWKIDLYKRICLHEASIYAKLDFMHQKNNLFQGYFWSCKTEKEIMDLLHANDVNIVESQIVNGHKGDIPPPTWFKLNEFTSPFQEIISTYGVPQYKEVNPAYFSIVTFPFLFGVMFGDVGHGSVFLIFAIFLWMSEKHLRNHSLLKTFVEIRYLLLLMGFFSLFWGLLYNDFMSIPLELHMNSCYTVSGKNVTRESNWVYGFGLDYRWYQSENMLDFMNSLKMKLAVIIGVTHMTLGIFLKALNARYFYNSLNFYFEFIPQFTLLLVTFGYMDLMIIIKWLTYYKDTSAAPSIIAIMIDMMLGMGEVKETPLIGSRVTHEVVNMLVLIIALLWVPTMLCVKPLILINEMKKHQESLKPGAIELGVCSFSKRKLSEDISEDEEDKDESDDEDKYLIKRETKARRRFGKDEDRRPSVYDPKDDPYSINGDDKKDEARDKLIKVTMVYRQNESHSLQEIWIHQLIETIEFVLGTISNTASYLRLWALSLAHSQLSAVFYEKIIQSSVENGSWIALFFLLPLFLSANFFILICMDAMEWFLHTLRLHWVEFQNKFYKGTGYKFNRGVIFQKSVL